MGAEAAALPAPKQRKGQEGKKRASGKRKRDEWALYELNKRLMAEAKTKDKEIARLKKMGGLNNWRKKSRARRKGGGKGSGIGDGKGGGKGKGKGKGGGKGKGAGKGSGKGYHGSWSWRRDTSGGAGGGISHGTGGDTGGGGARGADTGGGAA